VASKHQKKEKWFGLRNPRKKQRKKGISRLTLQSIPVLETLEELQTPSVPQVKFSVRNAFVPGEKRFFFVAKI